MRSTSRPEKPRDDELRYLFDGTKHFVDANGNSVPEYKIIVDKEGDEQVTLTINALDMRKLPGFDESRYVSVKEAKKNTIQNASNVLSELARNYIQEGDANERNQLMALYQGTGINAWNTITDLKNEMEEYGLTTHSREFERLGQLERDILNFKKSKDKNNYEQDYELINIAFSLDTYHEHHKD